jgi:Zn-dependent peptidase ImmA (M78 family)
LRHGFKAQAERRAAAARSSLGLSAIERLDPWKFAESLSINVIDLSDLDLPPEDQTQLLVRDPDSWSGMTLTEDGVKLIVLNPKHSPARQASTLMHEIAHIDLDHVPATVNLSAAGLILLSDYNDEQEQEADWLGGALLLPEVALLHHRGLGKSPAEIARLFRVSVDLCSWRCRMTGVEKRLAHRSARGLR